MIKQKIDFDSIKAARKSAEEKARATFEAEMGKALKPYLSAIEEKKKERDKLQESLDVVSEELKFLEESVGELRGDKPQKASSAGGKGKRPRRKKEILTKMAESAYNIIKNSKKDGATVSHINKLISAQWPNEKINQPLTFLEKYLGKGKDHGVVKLGDKATTRYVIG